MTLALLAGGVFMPSVVRQEIIDSLASGFGLRLADPDAFGHALAFALLALLVRSGRPRDPLLLHLACWLLVGAATEVLQLFTPDRDAAGRRLADGRARQHRAGSWWPSSRSACAAASRRRNPRGRARPAPRAARPPA